MDPALSVHDQVADVVRALLPEEARAGLVIEHAPPRFTMTFDDGAGGTHRIVVERVNDEGLMSVQGSSEAIAPIVAACEALLAPPVVPEADPEPVVPEADPPPVVPEADPEPVVPEADPPPVVPVRVDVPHGSPKVQDGGFDTLDGAADTRLTQLLADGLPVELRASAKATIARGGFALGFADAEGQPQLLRAQVLDRGFRIFAQGRRYWFLLPVAAAKGSSLARHREVVAALNPLEERLEAQLTASDATEAPPSERLVEERLSSLVLGALPSSFEAHAQRLEGGFEVTFVDAWGARTVLRARSIAAGYTGIAHGRDVGFSFLGFESSDRDPAARVRYQGLAQKLLEREADFVAVVHATLRDPAAQAIFLGAAAAEGGATIDLEDPGVDDEQRGAPALRPLVEIELAPTAPLARRIAELLPEELARSVQVLSTEDGFAVGVRDGAGARHLLRARWIEDGFAIISEGRNLCVSRLKTLGRADDDALIERYRGVAAAFMAHEVEVLPAWRRVLRAAAGPQGVAGAPVAREELCALLGSLMPEDWRRAVNVWPLQEGFAVHFQDAAGTTHAFRVHTSSASALKPTFATLAFAPVAGADDEVVLSRLQTVAGVLLRHVASLASVLASTGMHPKPTTALVAADAPLHALVRPLLPAARRDAAMTVRVPSGFVVCFFDGAGAQFMIEAKMHDEESPEALPAVELRLRPDSDEQDASGSEARRTLEAFRAASAALTTAFGAL